ncbi:hypothetical protein SDC9_125388 [bioreactor metagenome]|uniref:Bacterial Ig-like domain-containing protein n=1 Tax=bioreactor metagenome TaxID=1076179 RepID=A0A645CN85_9ZZZZ
MAFCHQNHESSQNFHELSDTVENLDFSVIKNASILITRSVIYLANPEENQAPLVNVSDPEVSESLIKLCYNVSDSESTVEVFFDNQSLGNVQSERNFSLPKGEHTIKVQATDRYGNRGTDSTTVVNKEIQNKNFETPSQKIEYNGKYVIGYPEDSIDSNGTLYYYLDGFGPLDPGNFLVLTPGSHNLKIWSENENGTLIMEDENSDFTTYSMEKIEIDNPIADRKNPLVYISVIFASLVVFTFYWKWIKEISES